MIENVVGDDFDGSPGLLSGGDDLAHWERERGGSDLEAVDEADSQDALRPVVTRSMRWIQQIRRRPHTVATSVQRLQHRRRIQRHFSLSRTANSR